MGRLDCLRLRRRSNRFAKKARRQLAITAIGKQQLMVLCHLVYQLLLPWRTRPSLAFRAATKLELHHGKAQKKG